MTTTAPPPHPLIDRAERVPGGAQPGVRQAGARVRDEGHVVRVERFAVPRAGRQRRRASGSRWSRNRSSSVASITCWSSWTWARVAV